VEKEELKNRIAASIYQKDPNAEAYLFGSRARGDNRSDSDWDILILVNDPKFTNEIDDKFRYDLYDLSIETNQNISILIYPKENWESELIYSHLYQNIAKEGVRL